MAKSSFPKEGQADFPIDGRLAFVFDNNDCAFVSDQLRLREKGGVTVKGVASQRSSHSGQFVLTFKPESLLKPETAYELTLNDKTIAFTTSKDKTPETEPEYSLQVLLATINKPASSTGATSASQTCTITFQLQGSAPSPLALLHVQNVSRYSEADVKSGRLNTFIQIVPLGQVQLPEQTLTANAPQFEDCNTKEACLYVAYEAPDGTWHGPKKTCVKPQINEVSGPPQMGGCSTLQRPASTGLWMLLLLVPFALRRPARRRRG